MIGKDVMNDYDLKADSRDIDMFNCICILQSFKKTKNP